MKTKLHGFSVRTLLFALVLALSLGSAGYAEVRITVLGASDLHGSLTSRVYEDRRDREVAGLTRVASIVKAAREENPNLLLIDNRDTVQRTILTDYLFNHRTDGVHPIMDLMNHIGYDAMVLGNREFDFGRDFVKKIVVDAYFPVLAANIYCKEGPVSYADIFSIHKYTNTLYAVEVTGAELNHPLREQIVEMGTSGELEVPVSADGRTPQRQVAERLRAGRGRDHFPRRG